ncbi:MAG: lipoyl(octanoyl) transferase LipB [Dehalococcoidia bacterium]
MTDNTRTAHVYQLGTTGYGQVHKLQRRIQLQRREGKGEDTLLLTEHHPVFTLGRSHPVPDLKPNADVEALRAIEVVQTERGGDITYHGPGQLVAYGIIDLKGWDLKVLDYLSGLEETVIAVLADWGLRGERAAGSRGVWVAGRKIASVGLNVRRWVTMHGIALNVDPDLGHFGLINPCGMKDIEMTSLAREMEEPVSISQAADAFVFHFGRVFGCTMESVDLEGRRRAVGQ